MYKVSHHYQYFFVKGWQHFIETVAQPFRRHILTECHVDKVVREGNRVKVFSKGQHAIFDQAVIAAPPNVALKILSEPTRQEKSILSSFETCTTEVFLHTDPSWVPQPHKKAVANFLKDKKGEYCTFWSGALHPDKPDVYVTWGEKLLETPQANKTILSEKWLRTLPTVEYAKACRSIHDIQGNGGVWHCGAHVHALDGQVPSLWHENAFLSGKHVAEKLLKHKRA